MVILEMSLEGCIGGCQKMGGDTSEGTASIRGNGMCKGPETRLGEPKQFV